MRDDLRLLERLLADLANRASPSAEATVGTPLKPRLVVILTTARAGERVVAFEDLCQNLYEYDCRLT